MAPSAHSDLRGAYFVLGKHRVTHRVAAVWGTARAGSDGHLDDRRAASQHGARRAKTLVYLICHNASGLVHRQYHRRRRLEHILFEWMHDQL